MLSCELISLRPAKQDSLQCMTDQLKQERHSRLKVGRNKGSALISPWCVTTVDVIDLAASSRKLSR